jgi:signal transduction histidine kinase/ActR/RegA family two-component response regulator
MMAARRLLYQARTDRIARAEMERQLRYSDQLQQLTATLSRASTPDDVIHACLPALLHAMTAAAGAVTLVAEDGSTSDVANAVGYDDAVVQRGRSRPSSSSSPIAQAVGRRDLIVLEPKDRRSAESRVDATDELLAGHPGGVVVPLITSGRALGAVALSFEKVRAVDGDERAFLLNAGRHIAQALDRARLYDEAERARGEAEGFRKRADAALRDRHVVEEALRLSEAKYRALATRTSRLYSLSAGLSEAVTADALARVMVSRGKVVLGAAAGSVAILQENGTTFEYLYAEEYPPLEERRQKFPAEAGLCATAAVTTRRPVFIGSFAEWQEKYPLSASIAADGGYASAATLPLLTEGRVIGVVSFYFTAPVNFDDAYKALLTSVAQHCAQALERAYLYEAAERARADAEAANRSKDDFLSTISHELRTPLNAILGWAAMLRGGSMDAGRTQRALEAIFNNATRQGRLIEELLDVSRIVAGRAALDLQEVDLVENIRGAVEAMMPMASAKGVELGFVTAAVPVGAAASSPAAGSSPRLPLAPGVPSSQPALSSALAPAPPEVPSDVRVIADPRRLEQVFLNLLSNAVKFTPAEGRVTIEITRTNGFVDVRVADTGSGIDATFLPYVFDRFRQGNSTTTRSVGGLGLGLFIARHLVEAQHGSIRAESEGLDQGAAFTVRLKATASGPNRASSATAVAPVAADPPESSPELTGIRVLLVDDEADSREMMASALQACGATVVSATSAKDALLALRRSPIDVMLSDIAMPEKDGYELIREVRGAAADRIAALPAAAVTACVRNDEREQALAAGFQMHLAKPVHPAALVRAVATLARRVRV